MINDKWYIPPSTSTHQEYLEWRNELLINSSLMLFLSSITVIIITTTINIIIMFPSITSVLMKRSSPSWSRRFSGLPDIDLDAIATRVGVGSSSRHLFLCADQTKAKCCGKVESLQSWVCCCCCCCCCCYYFVVVVIVVLLILLYCFIVIVLLFYCYCFVVLLLLFYCFIVIALLLLF